MNPTKTNSLITYIEEVAQKNNLEIEKVAHILADSFKKVYLKEFSSNQIQVEINLQSGQINMWRYVKVVTDDFFYNDGDEDDETLIPLSKAQALAKKKKTKIQLNDFIRERIDLESFDKKFVRSILSIFNQLIVETVNKNVCEKWIKYKGQVMWGRVEKLDEINNKDFKGAVILLENPEGESTQAYITRYDMIQTSDRSGNRIVENLNPGSTYLFYIKDVHEFSSGWPVNLTRTSPEIVKYLMAQNISEISEGIVEIRGIARLAGIKTKIAVYSNDEVIDPVGSCIGPNGRKIKTISNQLLNEKIDILEWNADPIKLIVQAVTPGKILGYQILDEKEIILITDEENYLVVIGKKGANIKLVSILTGWNIEVKTVAAAREEKINYQTIDNTTYERGNISDRIFQKHHVSYQDFIEELNDAETTETKRTKPRKQRHDYYEEDAEEDDYFDAEDLE
ncbi:N utilization substance protein A [Mycoplasmoides fastidiosum]|uniref:Transcription termination/antitermination protein NusA n=1 Tax=Mycoplasmoides fastidiosum TaxID=92758 RepID=A0ABU0LY79_9BACT|nr:transcription termination factor NusA [Mycoplasmoides fastidiosum]MDQ0513664.1 N utilization substance protein A [Mycoplasmoides fastidiosum]UUD37916.1 transcription termination factor NusA [Mycoplasmoides fastidiosum]